MDYIVTIPDDLAALTAEEALDALRVDLVPSGAHVREIDPRRAKADLP